MSDFDAIQALVFEEQQAFNDLIQTSLDSPIELIHRIGEHIVNSGGKRLRPLLVLLSAKAFDYQGHHHIQLAVVIELLHTATLLHDDVVDHSHLRRGKSTANHIWGDHAGVLVGDFLYSRAFQLMVKVNDMKVMKILAQASNQMAEGEVQQLLNCHQPDISVQDYMQVIKYKTGTLFSAAAQMGGVLTHQTDAINHSLSQFGAYLGAAFQLVDDALDYSAASDQTGKNKGNDITEGKPTLPFIYALEYFQKNQKNKKNKKNYTKKAEILRTALLSDKIENMTEIIALICSTPAIEKTYQMAEIQARHAESYLKTLPVSPYREGLAELVKFALHRQY